MIRAVVEQCAACDRRFDVHFPQTMKARQEIHELEQMHLWPCSFVTKRYREKGTTAELYDTPWEDQPQNVFFHSNECEEAYIHADSFGYRECEACYRTVCQQHPGNGWQWQFREHPELGEICLRCYQEEILEKGQPVQDFIDDTKIHGGMFFSSHNREPLNAGFEPVEGFENYFIHGRTRTAIYNEKAFELIEKGYLVVTGFERLAIGGLEGYITMFARRESPKSFHG